MGKFSACGWKTLCLFVFFSLGANYGARADVFAPDSSTASSSTFYNVTIYGWDGNAADNPWGLGAPPPPQYCSGGPNPCSQNYLGTEGTEPSELATVTFYNTTGAGTGGFTITPNAGVGTVNTVTANQNTGFTNLPAPPCAGGGASVTAGAAMTTTAGSAECTVAGNWTFSNLSGQPQSGGGILQYLGTVNGYDGIFAATDTSVELTFQLNPTPELPSLALFGTGLVAVGFFLRRQGLAL